MAAGFQEASLPYITAHQMGTARMGSSAKSSVCDPDGQCWHVQGLYVCDGSALPTSIGAQFTSMQLFMHVHAPPPGLQRCLQLG